MPRQVVSGHSVAGLGGPPAAAGGGPATFAWTVLDQAISSLSNVAIALAAARSLSDRQFGAFGVAFALSIVALGISRAVASEPFVVLFSGVTGPPWRRAVSASLSAPLAVSLVLGPALLVATAVVGPDVRGALIALAVALPGLLLQDALRFTFFAEQRPQRAVACDVLWCAVAALPAVTLLHAGGATAEAWLLAWAAGAYGSAGAFLLWLRPGLSLRDAVTWCRQRSPLAGPFVVEFLLVSGTFQIVTLGVGAIAGLVAVASIRGATTVLGPCFVAVHGLGHAAAPHAVRLFRQASERLGRFLVFLSGVAALIGLAGCAAVLVPPGLGAALLGTTWPATRPILVPLALTYATTGAGLGAVVGLRALGAARASLVVQAISAPVTVAAGLSGAALAGAAGAIWAVALARCLCLPLWWRQLRRSRAAATDVDRAPSVEEEGLQWSYLTSTG